MVSTRRGQDYQGDAAVAEAIAAVAAASEANAKADTGADARANAKADAGADSKANTKAVRPTRSRSAYEYAPDTVSHI